MAWVIPLSVEWILICFSYPYLFFGTISEQKLFKLPQAPSPPDSLNSDTSSYNSPGPSNVPQSQHSSHSQSRRPLTPAGLISGGPGSGGSGSGGLLHNTASSSRSTTSSLEDSQEDSSSSHHHHTHHHHTNNTSSHHPQPSSAQSHHPLSLAHHLHLPGGTSAASPGPSTSSGSRAHYLSANSVVYFNYNGDVSRIVDEHFIKSDALAQGKVSSKSKSAALSFLQDFHIEPWRLLLWFIFYS